MKRILSYTMVVALLVSFNSCTKTDSANTDTSLTQEVKDQILALGFTAEGAYAADGGYVVEGDIFLTDEDLQGHNHGDLHTLITGNAEQYRTTNLVTGFPRTITVSSSGNVSTNVSNAIDAAIARYNAVANLDLDFVRVPSGGDINIRIVNGGSYIASAGFPSGGNPYNEVKFNKQYQNWGLATLASVFAHEMGHCIGFRHTDYMDRSFSCGGATANEGASTVGAVHIPGTPTTADPGSWMLACIGNGIDRPFNNNDRTALTALY